MTLIREEEEEEDYYQPIPSTITSFYVRVMQENKGYIFL